MRQYIFNKDWISGFTQSDGSFVVSFTKRSSGFLYRPVPSFILTQSIRELEMMNALKSYLNVGHISIHKDTVTYTVNSLTDIENIILPLFDNSLLLGGKLKSYLIFRKVVLFMKNKEHLNLKGFLSILELAYFTHSSSLRTEETKNIIINNLKDKYGELPNNIHNISIENSITNNLEISDNYIAGLLDGDGSLNFRFSGSRRRIVGNFTIVQALEDNIVLEKVLNYFNCGNIYSLKTKMSRFQVEKAKDLHTIISPFLKTIHLNTVKNLYLTNCYKAWEILAEEGIKSNENLKKVVDLVYDMNQEGKYRKLTKDEYLKLML